MFDQIIIGCGEVGRRVADHYLRAGASVAGLVRSAPGRAALRERGIAALEGDLDRPLAGGLRIDGRRLFHFAPPPREGVLDTRVAHLIDALQAQAGPRRLVHISTTGVYGDCGGAWVDEQRQPRPLAPRARRRWDAEQRLRRWREAGGGELVILRVAGIYGPGKLPLERLRKGLPVVRGQEAPYTNRIHIEDLARVCVAAMERGRDGEVYNVSDGHPGTMSDYFDRVADHFALPRPPRIGMAEGADALSPGMMSYMAESRRLDNRKMLRELGVELAFPDLEAGLAGLDPEREALR
ncbi:MAG: SDR family oxidoreductase [Candidatus Sedimenticola endophacoides]